MTNGKVNFKGNLVCMCSQRCLMKQTDAFVQAEEIRKNLQQLLSLQARTMCSQGDVTVEFLLWWLKQLPRKAWGPQVLFRLKGLTGSVRRGTELSCNIYMQLVLSVQYVVSRTQTLAWCWGTVIASGQKQEKKSWQTGNQGTNLCWEAESKRFCFWNFLGEVYFGVFVGFSFVLVFGVEEVASLPHKLGSFQIIVFFTGIFI